MNNIFQTVFVVLITLILIACSDDDNDDRNNNYRAEITRTSYGIPHIRANDWGSLGFGHGYSFAEDRFCMLMQEVIKASGQSAELLGEAQGNINDDLIYALINNNDEGQLEERYISQQPDYIVELVEGYAAGFNQYLAEVGVDSLPESDPACSGEDYVRELTAVDLWKYFRLIQLQGSTGQGIIKSALLAATGPNGTLLPSTITSMAPTSGPTLVDTRSGSNAIALGSDATQTGTGMLLGNPHQPWQGVGSWYQVHLTIPGEYDTMGAALAGFPMIGIGFNQDIAWTQTVSLANRFTLFELTINPDNALEYIVDGEAKAITPETVSVKVTREDGTVDTVEHTFYHWEYGLIASLAPAASLIDPDFEAAFSGWPTAAGKIYGFRDANIDNLRGIDMFIKVGQSENIEQLTDAYKLIGNPLFHTLAADRDGSIFYGEISAIPNIPQEKVDSCVTGLNAIIKTLTNDAIVVLDGSTENCNWGVDDDAPEGSGLFGYDSLPKYISTDYALNSNDSYWLSNADNKLEGFPSIMGFAGGEGKQQNLRTQINHDMVAARLAGTDGFDASPGFTLASLQQLMYDNRVYGAEISLDDVLTICSNVVAKTAVSTDAEQPREFAACDQLARWDRKAELESEGTQIFTEFWKALASELSGPFDSALASDDLWATNFDPAQPLSTPRGFDTSAAAAETLVIDALSVAATKLDEAGVAFGAPWSEVQVYPRNGVDIPIHGGYGPMGVFGAISSSLVEGGYRNIRAGNSYIQTVTWDETDCPIAEGILTHSQSLDPQSPYFGDQTELYSNKGWVSFPYCQSDVEADAVNGTTIISGNR
jgi:acyl-homoserine-lactone acylase